MTNYTELLRYFKSKEDNVKKYTVEVLRKQIVFGNPGTIYNWEILSYHDTKKERDKMLESLQEDDPFGRYRAGEDFEDLYFDRYRRIDNE